MASFAFKLLAKRTLKISASTFKTAAKPILKFSLFAEKTIAFAENVTLFAV